MAFGAEIRDFVNGFTTGYKLIQSPEEKEWEREKKQMARDDHSRVRERDAVGDERWNKSFEYNRERDTKGDSYRDEDNRYRWNRAGTADEQQQYQRERDARQEELERESNRLKLRLDENNRAADEIDNFETRSSYDGWRGSSGGAIPDGTDTTETGSVEPIALRSSSGGTGTSSRGWLQYANQNATRKLPLSKELESALEKVLPGLGIKAEVFSGGQPEKGDRVGSVRHNHGNAADVRFYDQKTGRRLNWANPKDRPLFAEIVRRGKEAGITGWGAGPGYMSEGSMHLGFGKPGVWGAGGKGKNAPKWLRDAYFGESALGAARGGLVTAIPGPYDDSDEILDEDGDGMPDAPPDDMEVAQVLPEEGPVPGTRPQYEGVSDDTGAEADDAPTDDPYETARRAVREGMKAAVAKGKLEAQQVINDPEMQKYQERYIRGYGAAPQQVVKQMMDKIDPNREMSPTQRNVLAYANTYRFFYERGEPEKAKEAAMSLLQYHQQAAQQYLALGKAAAANGDLDAAAEAAVKAYANIPNGRDMQITKTDGGYQISVTDVKTGKPVTTEVVSPDQFAAAAAGFNPDTFNQEIYNAAGVPANKYDDASLEDRGNISAATADSVSTTPPEGLQEAEIKALRDIATDIAATKENGIDPEQAVSFVADLLKADPSSYSVQPERGVPGKVRVSFNGEEYIMGRNQLAKLRGVNAGINSARVKAAEDAAKPGLWSKFQDNMKKAVGAFSEIPEEAEKNSTRNASEAGAAIGTMGSQKVLPDGVPEENEAEIRRLLKIRERYKGRPERYDLEGIEKRLRELGWTE